MSEDKNKQNEDQYSSWEPKSNRFVAYLDILGFKNMVMQEEHDAVYKKLEFIRNESDILENLARICLTGKYGQTLWNRTLIKIISFSDSIIIVSRGDQEITFKFFLHVVGSIFRKAIKAGIPIKGGIAHGSMSVNDVKQIYFGQPLIDAFELEGNVNYIGLVAHNTIDKYIGDKKGNADFSDRILSYFFNIKTPLKSGRVRQTNYNWFKIFKDEDFEGDNKIDAETFKGVEKTLNELINTASGSARKYADNTLDIFYSLYDEDGKYNDPNKKP